MNKAQKDAITKNNQIFRQRMSALGAENTQLKATLETAQKESAAISEERDALKASAPAESASAPPTEELERLRREKTALEQALQEEKSKPSVQASIPDTSDLEARLVRIGPTTYDVACLTLPLRPHLHRSETDFSQKKVHGQSPRRCLQRQRPFRKTGKLKRRSLSRTAMKL